MARTKFLLELFLHETLLALVRQSAPWLWQISKHPFSSSCRILQST